MVTILRTARYTVGQLAVHSGVNLETIRYFERIGLLQEAQRTENGHRRFDDRHLDRLTFIRQARDLGFSQDEVRNLIHLAVGSVETCGRVKVLAEAHATAIRKKIKKLTALEQILTRAAAQCSNKKEVPCPVIGALSGWQDFTTDS